MEPFSSLSFCSETKQARLNARAHITASSFDTIENQQSGVVLTFDAIRRQTLIVTRLVHDSYPHNPVYHSTHLSPSADIRDRAVVRAPNARVPPTLPTRTHEQTRIALSSALRGNVPANQSLDEMVAKFIFTLFTRRRCSKPHET